MNALPGPAVSLAQLATDTTELLARRGLIDAELRERLSAARPARETEIRAVFVALGVVAPASPRPVPATGSVSSAPAVATSTPIRILHISDLHLTPIPTGTRSPC